MARRSIRHPDLNVCPACKKIVEYGLLCECCASWFHATEQCCGDALANAFLTSGRDAWCCLNCFPRQGEPPPPDAAKQLGLAIDHVDWRRAFQILTDSCPGCGLTVHSDSAALRCSSCELAYHALERCTGLGDKELSKCLQACAQQHEEDATEPQTGPEQLQAAVPTAADSSNSEQCTRVDLEGGVSQQDSTRWRCPTCMVHETGAAIESALVLEDVSGGQERLPIPLLNEVDPDVTRALPVEEQVQAGGFEYAKQCVWRHPRAIEQLATLPTADWGGRCIDSEATSWLPATDESGGQPIRREASERGGSAYNREGCLLFARDCIFECNSSCSCDDSCPNRVVGRGVWAPLQVVKTAGRGWGVRCRTKLAAGSFICEYA